MRQLKRKGKSTIAAKPRIGMHSNQDRQAFGDGDEHNGSFWELALAVNAAFKGVLGASGQSGHICARTIPIRRQLNLSQGWKAFVIEFVSALPNGLADGDVVVVADKIVALALNRVGPREIILNPDPKTVPPKQLSELARHWSLKLGFKIEPYHLLLADEHKVDLATLGGDDHNKRCADLAKAVEERRGIRVDVVISDTDTGLDIRQPIIGIVTIAATPLGATRGINLYEAMRCAVAAEFTRGHTRRIPFVICVPAKRRRNRPNIGTARAYAGILNASRETSIAHA